MFKPWTHAVDGKQLLRRVANDCGHVAHKAIDVSATGRFVDDVLVVVVAKTATELLVVHLGLVFARSPATRHLVRVAETELPVVAGPRDVVLARRFEKQLQQKLPQLDRPAACKSSTVQKHG